MGTYLNFVADNWMWWLGVAAIAHLYLSLRSIALAKTAQKKFFSPLGITSFSIPLDITLISWVYTASKWLLIISIVLQAVFYLRPVLEKMIAS